MPSSLLLHVSLDRRDNEERGKIRAIHRGDTSDEGGATASNARARILRGRHGQDRGDREGEARARGARGYRDRRASRRASPPIPSPPPARPDPSSLSLPHLHSGASAGPRRQRGAPATAAPGPHTHRRERAVGVHGGLGARQLLQGRRPDQHPPRHTQVSVAFPEETLGNPTPIFHLLNRENHNQNQTFLAQALRARHLRRIRRLHPGLTRPRTGT